MDLHQLDTLSAIQIGIPRAESEGLGEEVSFLQNGDFDGFGRLLLNSPKSKLIMNPDVAERAWVQPNDVLLISKGSRNTAVFYQANYPKAVASSAFYILRIYDTSTIFPEFLACYLNLPTTQNQLQNRIVAASTVLTLNKKDLLDLPIPVPTLEIQHQLIDLHHSFLDIHDRSHQQLNLQQALLYQCFSTTLQTHP